MDDNDKPILYGVSHLDGVTPIAIKFTPVGREMLIDETTTIAFDPAKDADRPYYPVVKATSDADNATILPWVVNAFTGGVLVTRT